MKKSENLTGKRFGRLIVLGSKGYSNRHHSVLYECMCDCGNTSLVTPEHLRKGMTQSCGCYGTERRRSKTTTHGDSHSCRLYNIWLCMRARCYKENSNSYKYYGAKGVAVCDEWKDSYENFKEWAISHGYSDALSIDRIDSNGDYCPENCRWATPIQQANNTSKNRFITYLGETKTASEWSREIGIKYETLLHRVNAGWSIEDCFEIPVQKSNQTIAKKLKTERLKSKSNNPSDRANNGELA